MEPRSPPPARKTPARPCLVRLPQPRDSRNCLAASAPCRLCGDAALPWGWQHLDTLPGPSARDGWAAWRRGRTGSPRALSCRWNWRCVEAGGLVLPRQQDPGCRWSVYVPSRTPAPASVSPALSLCRRPATCDALSAARPQASAGPWRDLTRALLTPPGPGWGVASPWRHPTWRPRCSVSGSPWFSGLRGGRRSCWGRGATPASRAD